MKAGIGQAMLHALKFIYTGTTCILKINTQTSLPFQTTCGIRQGAPSSSIIFIIFINDMIDYVRTHCSTENLIGNLHALLHADDTLILSTSRTLFIKKCNVMLNYFDENRLKLNLGKSGFLIINGKNEDVKCKIQIQNGTLEYKNILSYLGAFISDTGRIRNDTNELIKEKRSELIIKFTIFLCTKLPSTNYSVKLAVLQACVLSSITYGCEIWEDYIP